LRTVQTLSGLELLPYASISPLRYGKGRGGKATFLHGIQSHLQSTEFWAYKAVFDVEKEIQVGEVKSGSSWNGNSCFLEIGDLFWKPSSTFVALRFVITMTSSPAVCNSNPRILLNRTPYNNTLETAAREEQITIFSGPVNWSTYCIALTDWKDRPKERIR
jgi:hypothetical protein